jgi:predicted RNase H-like HicB family nuclease
MRGGAQISWLEDEPPLYPGSAQNQAINPDAGWFTTGRVGGRYSYLGRAGGPVQIRCGAAQYGRIDAVTRIVHVLYTVEQDEDGVWCASAQIRPGVGAVGDGPTREAAVADLRDALEVLLAEVGPPDELTLALDVA